MEIYTGHFPPTVSLHLQILMCSPSISLGIQHITLASSILWWKHHSDKLQKNAHSLRHFELKIIVIISQDTVCSFKEQYGLVCTTGWGYGPCWSCSNHIQSDFCEFGSCWLLWHACLWTGVERSFLQQVVVLLLLESLLSTKSDPAFPGTIWALWSFRVFNTQN